ncbi:hypothetical protein RGR602_PB00099 (plasmid) [Rhizobium gallicum bv. gallicum R602sp]|uniref:Uncharacterized protein n=1 Tax=Rhizobium gallicum bv. gallicum R602sp TaxID=1041138 RepID=A0A0B4XAJ7_9HYPH|nr:hypothetical protein RGR602_PB00099 [Rhizobium gallicum bv. gallicum R602sp]
MSATWRRHATPTRERERPATWSRPHHRFEERVLVWLCDAPFAARRHCHGKRNQLARLGVQLTSLLKKNSTRLEMQSETGISSSINRD